jgi:hypothetical protein
MERKNVPKVSEAKLFSDESAPLNTYGHEVAGQDAVDMQRLGKKQEFKACTIARVPGGSKIN